TNSNLVETDRRRREALVKATSLALRRGLQLCEEGDEGQGVLWLASGLEIAPADATGLQRALRGNLAGWGPRLHALQAVFAHPGAVTQVAFSPDGRTVLTACNDRTARLWDVATGQLLQELKHPNLIQVAGFGPDGRTVLTGCTDG